MDVRLIGAMGLSRQIGLGGALPWPRALGDLKEFRALTAGGVVIMGLRTMGGLDFERMDFSQRIFVGIGHRGWIHKTSMNMEKFSSRSNIFGAPEDFLRLMKTEFVGRTFWIAGGAMTYEAFAPFCEPSLSTINQIDYDGAADAFMPKLPWEE